MAADVSWQGMGSASQSGHVRFEGWGAVEEISRLKG